jgi:hypothetical protein
MNVPARWERSYDAPREEGWDAPDEKGRTPLAKKVGRASRRGWDAPRGERRDAPGENTVAADPRTPLV